MPTDDKGSTEFFFNPLRSRLLYFFVGAHLFFAIFLGEIFSFAPDEAGYLRNFSQLYKAGFSSAGLMGWQETPIIFLRIIYAPASLLHLVGVPSYLSIRMLSILTSAVALYLLMCLWRFSKPADKNPRRYLLVLAFTPSVFLWTSLGLRESFIFLSLAMIGTGIYLLSQNYRNQGPVLTFLGFWLLLNAKNYLFVLAALAIIIQVMVRVIRQYKVLKLDSFLLIAVVLPLIIYPPGARTIAQDIWTQAKDSAQSIATPTPTLTSSPTPSSTGGKSATSVPNATPTPVVVQDPGQTFTSLAFELDKHPKSFFSRVMKEVGIQKLIDSGANPTPTINPTPTASQSVAAIPTPSASPEKSTVVIPSASSKPTKITTPTPKGSTSASPVAPASPIPLASPKKTHTAVVIHTRNASRMNVTRAHLRDPASVVIRAGGFIFTPFPLIDNGSLFLDISAFEAPFWWFMYITFGIAVWRRFKRKELDELALFAASFIGMFVVFSALTENNVGTMIRHRSVILIPVLLLALPLTKRRVDLSDNSIAMPTGAMQPPTQFTAAILSQRRSHPVLQTMKMRRQRKRR